MLNRENTFYVAHRANALWQMPKGSVGRKMRRFLEQLTTKRMLIVSFAFDEGYSNTQLDALEAYAGESHQAALGWLPPGVVHFMGTNRENSFGMVFNNYELVHDVNSASVSQLRDMIKVVAILSQGLQDFAHSVNATALVTCPDYIYRGLPSSIASDASLWLVSGQDVRGLSGVLEWCFDETDALAVFQEMSQYPDRFKDLKAQSFTAAFPSDLTQLAV